MVVSPPNLKFMRLSDFE